MRGTDTAVIFGVPDLQDRDSTLLLYAQAMSDRPEIPCPVDLGDRDSSCACRPVLAASADKNCPDCLCLPSHILAFGDSLVQRVPDIPVDLITDAHKEVSRTRKLLLDERIAGLEWIIDPKFRIDLIPAKLCDCEQVRHEVIDFSTPGRALTPQSFDIRGDPEAHETRKHCCGDRCQPGREGSENCCCEGCFVCRQ